MATLTELREELAEKRRFLHDVFEEAGRDIDLSRVTLINGDPERKRQEINRLEKELEALHDEEEKLAGIERIGRFNDAEYRRITEPVSPMVHPTGNGTGKSWEPKKSLRDLITEHKGFQAFKAAGARGSVSLDFPNVEWKTLITLGDISPQADRRAVVDMALEDRTVSDLMLQGQTNSNSVEYFEETTVTNAAAAVAESTQGSPVNKPESALDWTLRTEPVQTIATWIPVTRQALEDVSNLESVVRGRLAFMVRREEEEQILVGDGTSPNISGILDRSGIQTQANGGGLNGPIDAVYNAMAKVRGAAGSGFAEPTAAVFHPNDWTGIKLTKTTDGIYLWGNPSDEGPDRIWGLPVRITTGMTENTALVGAFRPHAEVLRRSGITVTLSSEHGDFFIQNKVAVLAESRLALAVYRPSAFCTVTGI